MSARDQFEALGVDTTFHFIAEEIASKRSLVPSGVVLTKHVHPYDHASALVRGTVLLDVDGVKTEVTGPRMLLIKAGQLHCITSLTEVIWHCIHITEETDPEKVDAELMS